MMPVAADRTRLLTDWIEGDYKLLVAVAARVGSTRSRPLMLNCACEFCVISLEKAERAGWTTCPGLERQRISTRLGEFTGVVDRIDVWFDGDSGDGIVVDATWIIIADWPGPTVLGWRGCLERMLFAFDPMDNWFYFASA
jgi:hypothetical protein